MSQLMLSGNQSRVARLLDALGAAFVECSLADLVSGSRGTSQEVALILSGDDLARMNGIARAKSQPLRELFPEGSRILIWPFSSTAEECRAVQELVGGQIRGVSVPGGATFKVAPDRDLCGPFAGLEFGPSSAAARGFALRDLTFRFDPIATLGGQGLMTRVVLPRAEVFLAAADTVFDVGAEVLRNLRAVDCFSSLVPLIFFLRRCQVPFWRACRSRANLILDDPNLRPDYGCVNLRALADQTEQLRCAVTIGFIPWNFRRTSPAVVELFRARWPRLAICMHGCDHTGGEFATSTPLDSLKLAALGLDRMSRLASATALPFDKVMVFPQGIFSGAAMQALRQTELLAAVNTELLDRIANRGVPGGELLNQAITCYSGFPLFMRRKAEEPMVNFALDLLLGKPCFMVAHHEYFRGGLGPLASLVQSLSRLDPNITWENLETIVSRSFSLRMNSDSTADVKLFSPRTELTEEKLPPVVRFQKSESLADKEFRVCFDGRQVESRMENGTVLFSSDLKAGPRQTVTVSLARKETIPALHQSLNHRVKVSARRYLSELRDNYAGKSPLLSAMIASARQFVRGLPNRSTNRLPRSPH